MHLARQTIAYFDKDEKDLNDMQIAALEKLNAWRDRKIVDILSEQKNTDFDKLIPQEEMREILRWINELFFGYDSSRLDFRWASDDFPEHVGGNAGKRKLYKYRINLKTSLKSSAMLGRWILEILSCLLHEAVHIHQQYHGCDSCLSAEWNCMRHGHGRAFQLLASRVESCFVRFTGLPVMLVRYGSIEEHWAKFWPLPSLHDWEEWRLEDELLMPFYAEYLIWEFGRCGNGEFRIMEFAEKWWAGKPSLETVVVDGEERYQVRGGRQEDGRCCGLHFDEDGEPVATLSTARKMVD